MTVNPFYPYDKAPLTLSCKCMIVAVKHTPLSCKCMIVAVKHTPLSCKCMIVAVKHTPLSCKCMIVAVKHTQLSCKCMIVAVKHTPLSCKCMIVAVKHTPHTPQGSNEKLIVVRNLSNKKLGQELLEIRLLYACVFYRIWIGSSSCNLTMTH
jgi:hypothetical protein